jgi:hypothetical protein
LNRYAEIDDSLIDVLDDQTSICHLLSTRALLAPRMRKEMATMTETTLSLRTISADARR